MKNEKPDLMIVLQGFTLLLFIFCFTHSSITSHYRQRSPVNTTNKHKQTIKTLQQKRNDKKPIATFIDV